MLPRWALLQLNSDADCAAVRQVPRCDISAAAAQLIKAGIECNLVPLEGSLQQGPNRPKSLLMSR
eukprot:6301978-Pyramimonas_sp.AAC.1